MWWIELDEVAKTFEAACCLTPEEMTRADRFAFSDLRRTWCASRAALRHVLASALKCSPRSIRLGEGECGKPFLLDAPRLRFNLSHSAKIALLALSYDLEVGVDVEAGPGVDDPMSVARSVFSPVERSELSTFPTVQAKQDAFLRGWTRKEAFVKAVGDGLSHPLGSFDVRLSAESGECLLQTRCEGVGSSLEIVDLEPPLGWFAALAMQTSKDGIALARRRLQLPSARNIVQS